MLKFNMCIMLYFSVGLDRLIHYCASLHARVLKANLYGLDDYWPNVGSNCVLHIMMYIDVRTCKY